MTLDEAIKHAEEVAEEKRYEYQDCLAVHDMENAMVCGKCGEEHEQLAEWLRDYKRLKEQESFINKPCVSSEVCEHDKNNVLDKIRAEIKQNSYPIVHGVNNYEFGMTLYGILQVLDKYKYKAESEIEEGGVTHE